jgi:beta-lactam-binding protein with PASTA domain
LVKPGRKIYLTINSVEEPSIVLPPLKDYTVRQVMMKAKTYGLKIDSLIYTPAECDECVIGVMYNGVDVEAGARIPKGSEIWLVVGEGFGTEKVAVPSLMAQPAVNVKSTLNALGLNIGFVRYDSTVVTAEDSQSAFVYQQNPVYDSVTMVRLGTAFDVYLTVDSNKIDTLQLLPIDTNKTQP